MPLDRTVQQHGDLTDLAVANHGRLNAFHRALDLPLGPGGEVGKLLDIGDDGGMNPALTRPQLLHGQPVFEQAGAAGLKVEVPVEQLDIASPAAVAGAHGVG